MIERIDLTFDDGSKMSWTPGKSGGGLKRLHQLDIQLKKDAEVSFVSRPDLRRCKVNFKRRGRQASLVHEKFLQYVVDRLIEAYGG